MPKRPVCSYCGERFAGKLAQIYQWWYVDEERVAFKLHTCPDCLVERWKILLQTSNSTSTDGDTCIGCGGSLETDDSTVYLNLYLPKQPEKRYELDFDAPCAARICADTSDFGTRLENRGAMSEGPSSGPLTSDPWTSVEL